MAGLSTAFAGTAAVALTSDDVVHPEGLPWEHLGLFSAYDCGALRWRRSHRRMPVYQDDSIA